MGAALAVRRSRFFASLSPQVTAHQTVTWGHPGSPRVTWGHLGSPRVTRVTRGSAGGSVALVEREAGSLGEQLVDGQALLEPLLLPVEHGAPVRELLEPQRARGGGRLGEKQRVTSGTTGVKRGGVECRTERYLAPELGDEGGGMRRDERDEYVVSGRPV